MRATITLLLLAICIIDISHAYTYPTWYLAGSFNYTKGATNVPSSPNVVAVDTSQNQYVALGSGTNAPAFAIGKDSCGNVYFAGAFTTANGVATGPIAKYANNTFTSVANATTVFAGTPALISAMYVDCQPNSCDCDIWIGGNFGFIASDGQAAFVARWIASSKQWSNLGGIAAHGISYVNQEVGAVQSIGRDSNNVYFAGSFSGLLKYYTVSTGSWSSALMPGATAPTTNPLTLNLALPIIQDMRVVVFGSTTAVYVGGNFKYNNCQYFCGYYNNNFTVIGGTNNQPNGPVFGLGYDNNSLLYMVGNFTAGASGASMMAYTTISSSSLSGSDFSYPGAAPSTTLPPMVRIDPLDPSVYQYSPGSYGVTSFAGLGFFYDADVRILFPFGTATVVSNTDLYFAIVNVPTQSSSAILGPSVSLIIICFIAVLFFFN